jgi:hypothetical protein
MPKRPDLREFVLLKSTMINMDSEDKTSNNSNGDLVPTQPKKAKVNIYMLILCANSNLL